MPDRREILDRAAKAFIAALAVLAALPVLHLIGSVIVRGGSVVAEAGLRFLTEIPPPPGGRVYGVAPSLAGTVELTLLATAMGVPLAFAAAVLAVEFPESPWGRAARLLSRVLMEVPTVLVGMLVFALIVAPTGTPSILAASVALALVMLPYVTVYVEDALSRVPPGYREAGLALALTRAQVVAKILVPMAGRGVVTGVLLGVAKAAGETAPLLFTLGRARGYVNLDPLGPGDSLSLLIYDYAAAPYENMRAVAWGAAFILVTLLLVLYALARLAARGARW